MDIVTFRSREEFEKRHEPRPEPPRCSANTPKSEVKSMFIDNIVINVTGSDTVEDLQEKIKEAIYNITGQPMIKPEDNFSIAFETLRGISQSKEVDPSIRVRASELLLQHS